MNPINTTKFLQKHSLSLQYLNSAQRYFDPLAENIMQQQKARQKTLYLGVSGCQGCGKTTLADYLCKLFIANGLSACTLSLDDFYLTAAERKQLAQSVHPLLATRGVPGTHDIERATKTLLSLAQEGFEKLPRFDKSIDDRRPVEDWQLIATPVDIVILEGWCIGINAQDDDALVQPINELEKTNDSDAHWRNYVNQQLADNYVSLWELLDINIMLSAPSFESVFAWRLEQEEKLRKTIGTLSDNHLMSAPQIYRFIMHYERLTKHALETLPNQCDWVINLDDNRRVQGVVRNTTD